MPPARMSAYRSYSMTVFFVLRPFNASRFESSCRCSIPVGADSQLSIKFLNYELRRHVRYEQGIGYRPKDPIFLQLPAKEMVISTPLIAAIKPDYRILARVIFRVAPPQPASC
jgi:hypothetical protein